MRQLDGIIDSIAMNLSKLWEGVEDRGAWSQRVGFLYQVAKVLGLLLQHQSFNEYTGLISFRTDWFDLFAVQGILKSLLQHHNLKASILQCSAFLRSNSHIHT